MTQSNHRAEIDMAYQKKVLGLADQVIRRTALSIDADLVKETPVDTGRARSNWLPSINTPSSETVGPSGKINIQTVLPDFNVLTDTIYITNNLPYIRRLNDGHSAQAPAGFVDDVVARNRYKTQDVARILQGKGFFNA